MPNYDYFIRVILLIFAIYSCNPIDEVSCSSYFDTYEGERVEGVVYECFGAVAISQIDSEAYSYFDLENNKVRVDLRTTATDQLDTTFNFNYYCNQGDESDIDLIFYKDDPLIEMGCIKGGGMYIEFDFEGCDLSYFQGIIK